MRHVLLGVVLSVVGSACGQTPVSPVTKLLAPATTGSGSGRLAVLEETVAKYNLTTSEREIGVSWLFEPGGYLDSAVSTGGVSARQALQATPTLDVLNWIRTNVKRADTVQSNWDECAMLWWIWKNDNVNITPGNKPAEAAAWVTTLQGWDASLTPAAIQRATDAGTSITLTTEAGGTTSQPLGQNRTSQKNLIAKVVGVLQ